LDKGFGISGLPRTVALVECKRNLLKKKKTEEEEEEEFEW
jgi:hypothetical protein